MADAVDQIAKLAEQWGADSDKLYGSSFKEQQRSTFMNRPSFRALEKLRQHQEHEKNLKKADPHEDAGLLSMVQDVAEQLGIDPPEAVYVDTRNVVPNAYMNKSSWDVTFTLSLLQHLTKTEQRAITGHELHHFRQPADAAFLLPLTLPFIASAMSKLEQYNLLDTQPIQKRLDRYFSERVEACKLREFEADYIGATVASPTAMANALIKISAHHFDLVSMLPTEETAPLMDDKKLIQALDTCWHRQYNKKPATQLSPHSTYSFAERIECLRELELSGNGVQKY